MGMEFTRRVQYVYTCDACAKEYVGNESTPEFGVMGRLEFPNSAHGQRQSFPYWSCQEDATHIAKAMKKAHTERMENVKARKSRGEKFDKTGKTIKRVPIENPPEQIPAIKTPA